MRVVALFLSTLMLIGCSDEAYTPNPPQPDTSITAGDEGVLRYASYICDSVELYEIGIGEATDEAMASLWEAYDKGHCLPENTENLPYRVVETGPVLEGGSGCHLRYMTTIDTEDYGVLYVSSDKVPGITQEQIDYRVQCREKLRAQNS